MCLQEGGEFAGEWLIEEEVEVVGLVGTRVDEDIAGGGLQLFPTPLQVALIHAHEGLECLSQIDILEEVVVIGQGGQYLLPHDCQSLLDLLPSDVLAELAVLLGGVEGVAGRGGRAAEHNICGAKEGRDGCMTARYMIK